MSERRREGLIYRSAVLVRILSPDNWRSLARVFAVFASPLQFFVAVLTNRAPESILLRTPIGEQHIALRNIASLHTLFTVFCREDYPMTAAPAVDVIDIGANIGAASLYFLTRNATNTVVAYEADQSNLPWLMRNLAPFGARARIVPQGVGPAAERAAFYLSADGKSSSLRRRERQTGASEMIDLLAFADVLAQAQAASTRGVVVKLDVEKAETLLLKAVHFGDYPKITRVLIEQLQASRYIDRPHTLVLRNDAVEDVVFTRTEP